MLNVFNCFSNYIAFALNKTGPCRHSFFLKRQVFILSVFFFNPSSLVIHNSIMTYPSRVKRVLDILGLLVSGPSWVFLYYDVLS